MKSSWFTLRHTVEGVFWRGTAAAAGFAAHHRRQMRWFAVALIAAGAFLFGRLAAGLLLPPG